MSRRAPNSARGYDCNAPNPHTPGVQVKSAADLRADQVGMVVMLALRNGRQPIGIAECLWRFDATDADRQRIEAVLAEHRLAWLPWARLECESLPSWYWGESDGKAQEDTCRADLPEQGCSRDRDRSPASTAGADVGGLLPSSGPSAA